MNGTSPLVAFSLFGLLTANFCVWSALRHGTLRGRGVAAFCACYGAWLAIGSWLDPAMARAAHPYHALASSLALYLVMGFPAFVAAQVARK